MRVVTMMMMVMTRPRKVTGSRCVQVGVGQTPSPPPLLTLIEQ